VRAVPQNTIVALMGATASGKTELAMRLADAMPVAIISVDSAMIYRGMDIGTAKPAAPLLERYPHQLIDLKDPRETYSAGEFVADARACCVEALANRRLPLLVGGTMLYFNAFKHGLADLPPTPPHVREALAVRARVEGLVALHEELGRIDPVAAERIHPNNPQRLLRALEVYTTSGRPISSFWEEQRHGGVAAALNCRLVEYAIEPPRAAIHARIETRFERMLDAGLLDEVRGLMARGDLSLQTPSMRAVGYRQVWQHLCGDVDYAAMITNAVAATRQLAKRQLTWLRSWTGKSVLNDPAEAGVADAMLQSLGAERIVRRSQE
jgi:tRNA dimethylallyltransferase